MKSNTFIASVGIAAAFAFALPAYAQPKVIADSGDNAWVLASTVLIALTALPGLALFHGRGRIGASGLALFITMASTTLLFAMIGYSFAFGPGGTLIGGMANGFLTGLQPVADGTTISETVYAGFQMIVAVLATSILTASIAERARLNWLLAFIPFWFLLVYVPLTRWLVGGGWLAGQLSAVDFAGGMTVHASSGIAAFVVAMMLGIPTGRSVAHDSRLAIAGIALSWIGILALIAGSALGASEDAGTAMINAQIASAAAALVGALLERSRTGTSSFYGVATSTVAGLAAVSTGATLIGGPGAAILGVAGALAAAGAAAMMRQLSMGSAASAFVIHGAAGLIGALLFPLFIFPELGGPGIDETLSITRLLLAQLVAVGVVTIWTIVVTVISALMVSMLIPMRQAPGQ